MLFPWGRVLLTPPVISAIARELVQPLSCVYIRLFSKPVQPWPFVLTAAVQTRPRLSFPAALLLAPCPWTAHAIPCRDLGLISDDCVELGLMVRVLTCSPSAFLPFSAPPLWALGSPPQDPLPFRDQHLWHCGSLLPAFIHPNMSGPILAQMRRDMLPFLLERLRLVVPMRSSGHPTFYLC